MITYSDGKLWGACGGELEFVSMRTDWIPNPTIPGRHIPVVVVRFTDHDMQASGRDDLIDGKYYELTFPVACE